MLPVVLAELGTAVNVIIIVPLAVALLDLRSSSLRSTYRHETRARLDQAIGASALAALARARMCVR